MVHPLPPSHHLCSMARCHATYIYANTYLDVTFASYVSPNERLNKDKIIETFIYMITVYRLGTLAKK